MSAMNALYADVNAAYINPSANLVLPMVQAAFANVDLYGPGFVPSDELQSGIGAWISRRKKTYDCIVIGPNTAAYASPDQFAASVNFIKMFTVNRVDPSEVMAFFLDIAGNLQSLDIGFKVMPVITLDTYAMHPPWLERIDELGLLIWGPNHQFHSRLEELPDFAMSERHFQRNRDVISNQVSDFLKRRADRVITAMHVIGPQEFRYDALSRRPNCVAVPGIEYVQRKQALAELRRRRIKLASKWYFHLYRSASRLRLPVYAHDWTVKNYNLLYQMTLGATRFVYTACDASGIPLRKFFEIPAAGAVLVAKPIKSFADLGFEDGTHYIKAEPDELPDILSRYDGTDQAQAIARAGQSVVMSRHSVGARVEQFQKVFAALRAGTFAEAVWDKGEYVVRTKERRAA